MDSNLHKDHRKRVRQRFIETGFDGFQDHQILEMLLFYCYPRQDTNEIAHRMINEFGAITRLFEADVKSIMDRCRVSENVAVLMTLIPLLANLYFTRRWSPKTELKSAKKAGEFAISLFVGRTVEAFYILCLDARYQLNNTVLIAEGTLDETAVYPREIASEALRNQAIFVILTHNHPGGSNRPSRMDIEATRKIVSGLSFLKIEVLDHIVVAGNQYYSFADHGQYVSGY